MSLNRIVSNHIQMDGQELNGQEIEKKKKRCPKGTRKNKKGDCVSGTSKSKSKSKSPSNAVVNADTQKRPKCPKGTRRNKRGDCEPVHDPNTKPPLMDTSTMVFRPEDLDNKEILAELEKQLTSPFGRDTQDVVQKRKRCPKGQRQDKDGNCVPEVPSLGVSAPKQVSTVKKTTLPKPKPNPMVAEETDDGQIRNLNQLLRHKEYTEHKNPATWDFLYPELNDPMFNVKIAQRKEFHDTQYDGTVYDIEKRANELCAVPFELSPHQLFVKNFLSFQTPYNSLLLYHSLGTGKTCSAIGIAEEMRAFMKQAGMKEKILFVASPNLQGNFRKQLFDERGLQKIVNPNNPDEYTWNIESCVGNTFIQEMNPNQMAKNIPRERVVSNINTIIHQYYEFMGYGQLANFITDVIKVDTNSQYTEKEVRAMEVRNIRRVFNNRLIIIDEVHNIRLTDDNNNKTVASLLMKVAKYATNLKLLLLSATPMFNSYDEIIWLTNLMNLNDKRSTIDLRDVFDGKGEFKPATGKRVESGEELLVRKLTGYVSYVRGENPYVFPFRIYPKHFDVAHTLSAFPYPTLQMNGKPVDEPLRHVDVYLNPSPINTYQMRAYHFLMEQLKQRSFDVYDETGELMREMPSFEDMDAFGYSLLQIPLQSLNMVYPNPMFDDVERRMATQELDLGQYRDLIHSCVGEKGLNGLMTYDELHKPNIIKCNFEYRLEMEKKYGRVFSPQHIAKYSRKIANLCDVIRRSTGIVIVYSQYIDGGIIPACLALEEMGFTRGGSSTWTKPLFKTPPTEAVDSRTMQHRSAYTGDAFTQAKYLIISGDKNYSPNNKADMKLVTAPENADGSQIKVVFISKAGSEGLDFKNIRQIHIMEPWYNMNRIEQIIGRGVRNLSHCGLPFKQRNVQIFMHATVLDGGENAEAADLYVYRLAEKKALRIGRVTRLLKETAVDCILNVGQTHFTSTHLETVEANKHVQQELSSGVTIDFRVGDQPFTDICDYMGNCDLKCRPTATVDANKLVVDTYNRDFAHTNLQYISHRIRQLFREQFMYHRDALVRAINIKKAFPIEQIFMALSNFVDNKYNYVVDKYGRFGYILNVDVYYVFQPVELTDTQISLFERMVPVDYRRRALLLEVPNTAPALLEYSVANDVNTVMQVDEPVVAQQTVAATTDAVAVGSTRTATAILEELEMLVGHTQTPQNIKKSMDWYKHFYYARKHMESIYGYTQEQMTTYVVYHYLDTLDYLERIVILDLMYLGDFVNITQFSPIIQNTIGNYYKSKVMSAPAHNLMGVFVAHGDLAELWVKPLHGGKWTISVGNEHELFVDSITSMYGIARERLHPMLGFMGNFRNKEIVFKMKDLTQKRNNSGANVASAIKGDLIKMLNKVLGQERYTIENTDSITKVSLCCVLECIVRNRTTKDHVYFLDAERAILRDVTHL